MPGSGFSFGFSFPLWIFRLWTFLVFSLAHFCRVGEAAVPGPVFPEPDSFVDPPSWALDGVPDFCLGVFNPSGISNKFHMLDSFPVGWWHVSETQASKPQQCSFQSYLRSMGFRTGRHLRSTLGAPAGFRPGSTHAGNWAGVLSFGDCAMKHVPCVWPSGEFESGRVLMSAANIFGLEIVAATVYLPCRGPTYPNAPALSEELLKPITEELVLGRAGCRAILGDMNCPAGSLRQMELWQARGWIEVQDLMSKLHGFSQQPTCKNATCPDHIWLSPELAALVSNFAVWGIFPDHKVVMAGLQIPKARISELQWRLPGHIPWDKVNLDEWNSSPDLGPLFQSNPPHEGCAGLATVHDGENSRPSDSTLDFKRWSRDFELRAAQCINTAAGKGDRSFGGRGAITRPKARKLNAPIPKPSRPGEIAQASGFLNRAVSAWYKQMRRIQSYHHAIKSVRAEATYFSRMALWHSILAAPGFVGGFRSWWMSRPFQLQGAPRSLPEFAPDRHVAALIFEDFLQIFRRFEHWQLNRRKESCKAKLLSDTRALFAHVRQPSKPPLDFLVDTHEQAITVVSTADCVVKVPHPFPDSNALVWTLQGEPARVAASGDIGHYTVESDLVLATGQTLACQEMITSTDIIHDRLSQLWSPRWNKHVDTPPEVWAQVCQYASSTLPVGSVNLPPITVQNFRQAVKSFKATAATGPCGWTRNDLAHMTEPQIQSVLDAYHEVEKGRPWPKQWQVGLIHCLQKREDATAVNGFRPITVMSLFYRLFAGIRSGQILAQFSKRADDFQCGFMQGHQASDLWYFIGVCLELATHQAVPVHGITADLVKAYNTLPRTPVFHCLEVLGVPAWFLAAWKEHLLSFERFFVVRRCVGEPVLSVTGFPEGCPLACVAMTALDFSGIGPSGLRSLEPFHSALSITLNCYVTG